MTGDKYFTCLNFEMKHMLFEKQNYLRLTILKRNFEYKNLLKQNNHLWSKMERKREKKRREKVVV